MAPASNKRKRPERQVSEDDGATRPSPYKPEKSRMTRRTSQQVEKTVTDADEDAAANMPTTSSREGTQTPAAPAPNANGSGDMADASTRARPLYDYTHITDDVTSSWSDSGKQAVVDSTHALDDMQLSDIFFELVRSALDGRLTGKDAGLAIQQIVAARQDDSAVAEDLLLNTISFLYDAGYKGPELRPLVAATGLDLQRMREELDIPLLQELGLVRSTFDKMRTRKTTNALYRQANFNLLREESEGYAKLITEYFNTAQEASSRRDDDPFMAEDAFRRVEALIGAFDLDVGRVLDIIMDVSANLLVKAYPFFIKFYRASSWWPDNELLDTVKWQDQGFTSLPSWAVPGSGRWIQSDEEKERLSQLRLTRDVRFWDRAREAGMDAFFELGTKNIVDFESVLPLLEAEVEPELDSRGKESNPSKRLRLTEIRKYMRETHSLPPSGNYDAAQLLGFKLRFYASNARDAADTLPDNLIYLAALLIKIGFISLRDLYPHLYPADENMPNERARLEKEKAEKEAKERPGGGMNALLMAGALADDTLPTSRRAEKEKSGGATPAQDKKDDSKEELPAPVNQKILLLKAMLLIGALPEALFILGRFPWLAEVDVTLPAFLQRIARHMLSKVSESLYPLGDREGLQEAKEQLADTTARTDGTLAFTPRQPKKTTRWLYNDVFDKDDGQEFRHYYSDWSDNIPICQTFDDVFTLCNTFLGYIGPKIGQDIALYGTLLRLAHRSLTDDHSNENRSRWLELMKRLLVPGLSCSKHNPQLAQQVYDLLSFYPAATRYKVYAEWFTGRTSRLPDIQSAFAKNKAEVRDVLRRVSNDYVKKQSRALGKVALASPGIVMIEMINQLESYSNMIPSLVECTRYFSSLAYDVLNWALINSVSGQGRDRMQADGMLTSSWLQALSQFVASLFARYSHLNLSPILQYLASELRTGNSTDLELLEQVLVEMAGIRSDVEFNDSQVLAMAGGDTLRTHILSQLSDTRHLKKSSAQRLIAALDKPKLIGQTLVAIAQERQMYEHHESSRFMPLKVLGNNLDKIQAVFQQYLEVLKYNLDVQKFENAVPDVTALVRDFGMEPGVALTVCRETLQHRVNEFDTAKKQELEEKKEANAQNASSGEDGTNMNSSIKQEGKHDTLDHGDADASQEMEGVEDTAAAESQSVEAQPWHPVLKPIIQGLQEALPDLAARISIPFYVTFWTLNLYDVFVPMDNYQREMKRLEAQINEITSDRSDLSALQSRERERKKKNLMDLRDKLKQEPTAHLSAYVHVRSRISKTEKPHWFAKSDSKDSRAVLDAKHQGLLQECFLPRATMSSIDAHFSFTMMKILHDNGTPGFSLMHLLHQLFKKQQLATLMFQCTANEAQHLGRYLCETLKHLQSWHADKATYEKEALGKKVKLPGFVIAFDENGEPKTVIDYETFRRMLFNFHTHLSNALQACFESGEYMHIRNGIIVLKSVVQVFPSIKHIGKNMVDHVTKLSKDDPRQDLKLAAMSLLGPLKGREKHWQLPQAFRLNDPAKDGAKPTSRAASARPETPQPTGDTPKLNASAPEFKPTSGGQANGKIRKESAAGGPEDGEIEDEKPDSAKDGEETAAKHDTRTSEKENQRPTHDAKSSVAPDTPKVGSKPSTPAPSHSRPPPGPERSEVSRPSSAHATSSRQPLHDQPSRPENGARLLHGTPAQGRGGRYPNRNGPDERHGRLDRPSEVRPSSREHSPGHRTRGRSPPPGAAPRGLRDERPFDRPGERTPHDGRSARDDPYGYSRRDGPPASSRAQPDPRDRSRPVGRTLDGGAHPDRLNQISSVAVGPEGQQASRGPPSAAGPQPQSQDDQHHINPARMALIDGGSSGPGNRRGREAPPGDREPRREREPRMDDRSGPGVGQRPDMRSTGRGPPESPRDLPTRGEPQPDLAPTGPKRAGGRLREMGPPQAESSYGRLNGPSETPSGPRNGSGRSSRNLTGPVNPRASESAAPSPATAKPPESPASHRGAPSRQPSAQLDRSAPNSAPSTPASENGPQVHPSRAAQFNQPGPIQTSFQAPPNGPRNAGSPTVGPPAGPRGSSRGGLPSGTPTGPSPANSIPPSGPASGLERQKRGDRQRANINATLQGNTTASSPNGQGVNFRGASSRQPSMSQLPPSGPGSRTAGPPSVASSMEPPIGRPPYDGGRYGPEDSHARPDLFHGRSSRDDDGGRRREDRPHGSRNPSREPRPDMSDPLSRPPPPPPPPGGPSDSRDRRGGPPRDERRTPRDTAERDAASRDRRPERQPRGPPADMAGGFAGGPPPDWDRRGPRGEGDDRRGGRMGGPEDFRGGPRREEERGGRPPREEGGPEGRKRRHEDGSGFPGDPKRRRSAR